MPRYRRHAPPGSLQHIISRLVNREYRINDEAIRQAYLARAGVCFRGVDWLPLAYALMSTHIHWGHQAGLAPPRQVIHPLHSWFAAWLNRRQGRLGPVFAERFKNVTGDPEATRALIAYIHNNPVRAGVVSCPSESTWTSHRAYLALEPSPPWLDVEQGLALSEFDSTPSGRLAFHEYVVAERPSADPGMSVNDLDLRRANARAGLGPVELETPVLRRTGVSCRVVHRDLVPPRARWEGCPETLLRLVQARTGIRVNALRRRGQGRRVVSARRLALYTWVVHLGRPQLELARYLGLGAAGASYLLKDPGALAELEPAAATIAAFCRDLEPSPWLLA